MLSKGNKRNYKHCVFYARQIIISKKAFCQIAIK